MHTRRVKALRLSSCADHKTSGGRADCSQASESCETTATSKRTAPTRLISLFIVGVSTSGWFWTARLDKSCEPKQDTATGDEIPRGGRRDIHFKRKQATPFPLWQARRGKASGLRRTQRTRKVRRSDASLV